MPTARRSSRVTAAPRTEYGLRLALHHPPEHAADRFVRRCLDVDLAFGDRFRDSAALKRAANIVDVMARYKVELRHTGGYAEQYTCLCPFHEDTNPSMRVYPDRQSFRCWVCDEGGDVFTWVMFIGTFDTCVKHSGHDVASVQRGLPISYGTLMTLLHPWGLLLGSGKPAG